MCATSPDPTAAPPTQSQQPLALTIELDGSDDGALLRVLSLLARRRCGVLRAAFAPDPVSDLNLLHLELATPGALDANVVAWVSALVPVRSIRRGSGVDQLAPPAATAAA